MTGRLTTPLLVWVACICFGMVVVGLHVRAYPKLSPIDEFQHVDYLFAIDDARLPRSDAKVKQRTMREEACRGLDAGLPLPSCTAKHFDPNVFQERGFSTAAGHPPTYYAAAWAIGRAFDAVLPGVHGLVTGARLAGGVFLGAALALMWFVLRRFGVGGSVSVALLALTATTPIVIHASSIVNPDAMVLLAGSAFALALVRWDERRSWPRSVWLVLAVAFLVLVKSMNVIVLGGGLLYVLIRAAQRRRAGREGTGTSLPDGRDPVAIGDVDREPTPDFPRPRTRAVVTWAAATVVGLACVVGWLHVVAVRAVDHPKGPTAPMQEAFGDKHDVPVRDLLTPTFQLLNPVSGVYAGAFIDAATVMFTVSAFTFLLYGGLFGGSMLLPARTAASAWARATLVMALLSGLVVTLANYLLIHVYLGPLPTRYGLIYLPMVVVAMGVVCDVQRSTRIAAVLVAGAASIAMLVELIGG